MYDMTILINVIKQAIELFNQELKALNNSSSNKYKELLDSLRKDINNLADIDMSIIDEILSESDLSSEDMIKERNSISTYKKLLMLNKKGRTNFKLTDAQIREINKLSDIIKSLDKKKNKNKEEVRNIKLLNDKIKYLKTLLNGLEDENNNTLITDLDLIEEILNKCEVDTLKRKEILYSIMEYNQLMYVHKVQDNTFSKPEKLNIEEVRNLFRTYDYEFDDLKKINQEEILDYASINNMREIFSCLKELNFPKFDLKRESRKITSILINSDRKTIEDIVEYSNRKGLMPKDLMNIVPALISQNRTSKQKYSPTSKDSSLIKGRSEDYKKNIEFLESVGFDIKYVFDTCKIILTTRHSALISNYNQLQEYEVSINKTQGGELVHPALSCLISNNFEETIDTFIEISPLGHQYIINNLSGLAAFAKPGNIIFFNILASYHDQNEFGEPLDPEGPFNITQSGNIRLKSEVSNRLKTSPPYRGITEINKYEKTYILRNKNIENEYIFDRAIREAKDEELYDLTIENEVLESLESYIDKVDHVRYNFDGVLISRPKVKRIYNILINKKLTDLEGSLLYAITYNSLLTEEQFDKIKRIVKRVMKEWSK